MKGMDSEVEMVLHRGIHTKCSEKTILANGGAYESTVYEPNDNVHLKRFWITTK